MSRNYILVTGGAGFIGSHLCEKLVESGYRVGVIDNLQTGSLDNIDHLDVDYFENVGATNFMIGRDLEEQVAAIFHLGIPSSSPIYVRQPFNVAGAVTGYINVFEAARKIGCPVLYASSSSLYNGIEDQHEDAVPLVKDYYTEARYYLERIAALYKELHGVESIGFRFFSVYGPREGSKLEFANIVSQFLWCMQQGDEPLIYGDGKQARDFTYVEDLVSLMIEAMNRLEEMPPILNIASGLTYDFNEVVGILNNILETDIQPRYVENPIKNYVATTKASSNSKLFALFDREWTTLEEGIRKIIQYNSIRRVPEQTQLEM